MTFKKKWIAGFLLIGLTAFAAATRNLNTQTITNGSGVFTVPSSGTDTFVGKATTDILTNKTLTAPVISTISNTGTITLPTATTTLVGRDTTDTLTNKSIVASQLTGQVAIANGGTALSAAGTDGQAALGANSALVYFNLPGYVNCSGTVSISSNTMVTALKGNGGSDNSASSPCIIDFRSATATTGQKVFQSFTAASSVTAGTTDGLGNSTAAANTVYVYAIQDTTSELCYSNQILDEGTLTSAIAFTGGAEILDSTLYCPSVHTTRPIRGLLRIKATWSNPNWGTIAEVSPAPFLPEPMDYGTAAHGTDCVLARTNAAFGLPTADASCTFTAAIASGTSANMPTMSTSGGTQSILVFTPRKASSWRVCVSGKASLATSGSMGDFELYNSTASAAIAETGSNVDSNGRDIGYSFCGIAEASSGVALTIHLLIASSSGAIQLEGVNASTQTIMWSVNQIKWGI